MAEILPNSAEIIVDIALQIKEAVETVRQNEEECRKIARCVEINSGIVKILARSNLTNDVALNDVKNTFEEALRLVKKCQKKHILRRFFSAKDMANELDLVLRDMGLKMQQATLCSTVHNLTQIHFAAAPIAPLVHRPSSPPPLPLEEEDIDGFTRFSLSMLNKATNYFSVENKIGEGGFCSVYKGVLNDGREIAIKKFPYRFEDRDNMCLNEFIVGTKLQHKNVITFLGYCIDSSVTFRQYNGKLVEAEERSKFLVQVYMPNGSLEEIAAGRRHIDWPSCFKIIEELAQGIRYIHEQRVIHLDLKPRNILLDSNMSPVIIDFGLSKVLEHDQDKVTIEDIPGTLGFIEPERYSGEASSKSDVYGFGITVLRTIISRQALRENGLLFCHQENWEQIVKQAGGLKGLVNPAVHVDVSDLAEINRCVEVVRLCTRQDPAVRPSMAEVVNML